MSTLANVNLNLELGPVFLSHCFNWALYGLLCLQIYIFYASFPNDALRTKALVYGVFIIDSAFMIIATYSGYWIFVSNWGQEGVFTQLGWAWASIPPASGSVAFIVQTFFAYRIWMISKNWCIPVLIVILSGVACGFSLATAVMVGQLQTFAYNRNRTPTIWLGFGIASDFFVCATLVYYLLTAPKGFILTNRIIIRLVRISIETALVTIIAAAIKIYLIFNRNDNLHVLICLLLARLYSNSLLGTLNSRSPIFGGSHIIDNKRHTWASSLGGPGFSFDAIKKEMPNKKFKGNVIVTCSTVSDCETGIVKEEDEDGQVISYQPRVPTYPLSPTAPSYHTQRPQSTNTFRTFTTAMTEHRAVLPEIPTTPPSAKALLSDSYHRLNLGKESEGS